MFCADRVHTSPTVPTGTSRAVVVDDAQLDPRIGLAAGPQQVRAPDRVVVSSSCVTEPVVSVSPYTWRNSQPNRSRPFTSTSSVIGEAP